MKSDSVDAAFRDTRIQQAFRFITQHSSQIEADQIHLTEIAAPPFGESARAEAFAQELTQLDIRPVTDTLGNVIGAYENFNRNPVVAGAHLDTVFPASTPLRLRREGRRLFLPGISDNGAGIVALLWAFRAARNARLRFRRPVIAVGDIGEEGEGNLRGIRRLFEAPPWPGTECEFIAVDGAGIQRITNRALGSRRFRISLTGPGGHSWADFGQPNPVHAIATAIHSFGMGPRRAGTAFNFGVIRGGISVNAIPSSVLLEVDLRAVDNADLGDLDDRLRQAVVEAARASGVGCQIEIMGERPSGATSEGASLVRAAIATTRRFGVEPQLDVSSTDANIPMSLGIPAIAIGGGGTSGNVHTPDEWFDPTHREFGVQRLLFLIAVLAGME